MTYKASTKKESVDEDFDYLFTPKGGSTISSPNISSRGRSLRIKNITAIYESLKAVDDPSSSETPNVVRKICTIKKRKASNSVTLDHAFVRPEEEDIDLDEPLSSLKVKKGKKHRKLFHHTEGSSVDKVWISKGAIFQKSNNLTESVVETVEAISDKNIFDSGFSKSTYSLNSEIVETCDDVDCNMEVNPMTDISISVSEIKSNVAVINTVQSNNTDDVSASDEYINPNVEDYGSVDKINVTLECVLDKSDDTTISVQPQNSCVDEVEPMEIDSQTCIVQSNEKHFENEISIDASDTCVKVHPSYSESNRWTSSTTDWQLVISEGSYDDVVYDNQKNSVNEFKSINNCIESRLRNQGEKMVQATCNFGNDSAYKDVGSLDSLVFQALCGDAHINNHDSQVQLTVENNTSVEAYDSSHPNHSDTLFSSPSDLGSITTISSLENSVSSSAKIQTLDNVDERISNAANNIQSSTEMKSSLVESVELNNENELKCNQEANNEDQNYPKNLFQHRKELSPISQEKLCWYDDLDDTTKALGHVTDSIQSPEITRRRLKRNKKLSHRLLSKENMKVKDGSDGNYLCIQGSINTQSQKAVLFSQRQMQDIENIASKLLKEMSSLKNIVADIMNNDNVGSEACLLSYSKFTAEEISAAVGNASNLEAATKKWLAMMSKDCNRFCKIMSSTESNGSGPAVASKQSRKVTFADEAGGSLCHVKVFEQLPTADIQAEPKNGNQTAT